MLTLTLAVLTSCLPSGAALESGRHVRLATERGPVHLWCASPQAELVVFYVHGYFDDVDEAFREHALVRQFRASGLKALFVMIEAPTSAREPVRWPSLVELRAHLESRLEQRLPPATIAIGHSGGNRTLRAWAQEGAVADVVLLDAFYGGEAVWTKFIEGATARLTVVSVLTERRALAWLSTLGPERRGRVSHLRARTSHMGVVTGETWIPKVLASRWPQS